MRRLGRRRHHRRGRQHVGRSRRGLAPRVVRALACIRLQPTHNVANLQAIEPSPQPLVSEKALPTCFSLPSATSLVLMPAVTMPSDSIVVTAKCTLLSFCSAILGRGLYLDALVPAGASTPINLQMAIPSDRSLRCSGASGTLDRTNAMSSCRKKKS